MVDSTEFTIKEVVIEIKAELKSFRTQYDADQKKRDDEISKRPTRSELYSAVGVMGVLMGVVFQIMSGTG